LAATLVVPGALAIAVATIALGGGLRSLGTVAQIVTGPGVPKTQLDEQAQSRLRSGGARPTPLPSPPATPTAVPLTRAFRAPAATPAPRRTLAGPHGTAPVAAKPFGRRPHASAPPAGQAAPAAPAPQPQPQPSPVRKVGKQVASTVGATVPAPAGPAAEDAVTTVLDLVAPGPRAVSSPAP